MNDYLWLTTDNVIHIIGLKDKVLNTFINNATITATLKDANDVDVPGAVGLSLPYIAASDGEYAGQIPYTVSLTDNAQYTAVITIIGSGYRTTYYVERRAKKKGP